MTIPNRLPNKASAKRPAITVSNYRHPDAASDYIAYRTANPDKVVDLIIMCDDLMAATNELFQEYGATLAVQFKNGTVIFRLPDGRFCVLNENIHLIEGMMDENIQFWNWWGRYTPLWELDTIRDRHIIRDLTTRKIH